jgi:phosphatidate cytidylyltransferase
LGLLRRPDGRRNFSEQAGEDASKPPKGEEKLLVHDESKYKKMWTRVMSSVWMIGGFACILYMGHLYIWAMVVVIQLFMAQELFTLSSRVQKENKKTIPGFRLLNWCVFLYNSLF